MSSAPQTAPVVAPVKSEWANPAPAGLIALAVACFCFFALLTGKVTTGALPMLAGWLLGGFVVQVAVAIIELREGALVGGNIFLFFSAFFMLATALKYLIRSYIPETALLGADKMPLEVDHSIDGWAWLVLSLALLLWTPAYLKRSPAMLTMVILALDIGVPIVALRDLKILPAATWNAPAGWFLLIAGIFGIYVASAIIVNDAYGKKLFPMPGPILK